MSRTKRSSAESTEYGLLNEIFSAFLFTVGLFSLVSLIFYSSHTGYDLKGTMGSVGVYLSAILGDIFGLCSFFMPAVMFYLAYIVFTRMEGFNPYSKFIAGIMILLSSTTFLGLLTGNEPLAGYEQPGGVLGQYSSAYLRDNIAGSIGSYLFVTLILFSSLLIVTGIKISDIMVLLRSIISKSVHAAGKAAGSARTAIMSSLFYKNGELITQEAGRPAKPSPSFKKQPEEKESFSDDITSPEIIFEVNQRDDENESKIINLPVKKDFKLPPIDLLDPKSSYSITIDKDEVYRKARLIEEKLRDFGVSGKVTEIRPGPVITMFEYKPAPGIKINKIASLESDLAMGLSAYSIRIIAPIPGKNVIGIEVPNPEREVVALRELIEESEFNDRTSMLTLALGKDISGRPYYMNLRTAPHLMIAGTTGSGKSVLLNAILTSLFYKASPREIKFIMIDPKMLELSIYEDIPHLLHPVVTEPKKAAAALKWAVEEMEARYRILSEEGVRDIETHNRNIEKLTAEEKDERWLPYIIIVIDELADLMMIAPNEIKESITRLSQKARAAGIHLIVATQRPSADVVAGLLKANFPARISFLVSTKIDSRIILDTGGAERLLGKGDMLFLKPGTSSLVRIQGALISDDERESITDYLKSQGSPVYNNEITQIDESDDSGDVDEEKDELYYTALRIIAESQQASISMLQRKLKIGYNRAARIVEIMEKEGVIGQQESAGKPREVFIDLNQIKES